MSIRQDLQDYISDNGLSQSAVARAVGVTSPVVNQYLHGKYPGNVQEIERKIAAYLQKQREREAERKLEVDYVLTTTAKRVRDVLRLAHVEGEAVVLFGQAGLGKTSSLREYCKQRRLRWWSGRPCRLLRRNCWRITNAPRRPLRVARKPCSTMPPSTAHGAANAMLRPPAGSSGTATDRGKIVSRYRELVQHRLAVCHAGMELKLARAREQEPFVLAVERKLSAGSWDYRMGMTPNFGVVFTVLPCRLPLKEQYQAVKADLSEYWEVEFDVQAGRPCLHVGSRTDEGIDCCVVFDGDDDGC